MQQSDSSKQDVAMALAPKIQVNVQGTILWPDGAVITAGFLTGASPERALITRHLANGNLDPSFGTDGVVDTTFGTTGRFTRIYDIKAHGGGFIVAGLAQNANLDHVLVARFFADGALDTNFGTAGVVLLRMGKGAAADSLQIAGNKLYVGVSVSNPQTVGLVMFDDVGKHLNTTLVTVLHNGAPIPAYSLHTALDSAGRIVGSAYAYTNTQYATALRFLSDGSLDKTYQQQGYKVIEHPKAPLFPDCVAALPDDSIVIGGNLQNAGNVEPLLMRVTENGVVTYLKPALPYGSTLVAAEVHQGKILITGRANDKFLIGRTALNGTLDPAYGAPHGYTLNDFTNGWYQGARAVSVYGNHIMCAGVLNNLKGDFWMGLMKHSFADGALDPTFNNTGKVTYKSP